MTPRELKCNVEQGHDKFFFAREAMRFFGDTMRNYGVKDSGTIPYHYDDEGNNYSETPHTIEVWELYRKRPVNLGLTDSAYFDKRTYRRVFRETSQFNMSISSIKEGENEIQSQTYRKDY